VGAVAVLVLPGRGLLAVSRCRAVALRPVLVGQAVGAHDERPLHPEVRLEVGVGAVDTGVEDGDGGALADVARLVGARRPEPIDAIGEHLRCRRRALGRRAVE